MQLLAGSNLMGRIEHGKTGDQTGADMERVNAALERLELVYAEMAPGDGLFFHCNTLHRSGQNKSAHRRWTLLCCYNSVDFTPTIASGIHLPTHAFVQPWLRARGRGLVPHCMNISPANCSSATSRLVWQ